MGASGCFGLIGTPLRLMRAPRLSAFPACLVGLACTVEVGPVAPPPAPVSPVATATGGRPAEPPPKLLTDEPPDLPGAGPGLTTLLPESSAAADVDWNLRFGMTALTFGGGLLVQLDLDRVKWGNEKSCAIAGSRRCAFLAVGQLPGRASPRGWGPGRTVPRVTRWTALRPIEKLWSCVTPGATEVWATRVGDEARIDSIDVDANVRTVVSEEQTPDYAAACVVETRSGPYLVGSPGPGSELELRAIHRRGTLGAAVGLGLFVAEPPVSKHRFAVAGRHGRRPLVGRFAVASWVEPSGALSDSFLLGWDEATGPSRKCPTESACKTDGTPRRGHVSRFDSRGRLIAEGTAESWSTGSRYDVEGPAAIHLSDSEVLVRARGIEARFDHSLKSLGSGPARTSAVRPPDFPFRGPPLQSVLAAEFDAGAGEGIVIIEEGSARFAKRFDANGRFVGERVAVDVDDESPIVLGWVAGHWVSVNRGLQVLTGSRAGERWAVAGERTPGPILGIHRVGLWRTLLPESGRREQYRLPVEARRATTTLLLFDQRRGTSTVLDRLPAENAEVLTMVPGFDDRAVFLARQSGSYAMWELAPDGKTFKIDAGGLPAFARGKEDWAYAVRPVWKDRVLLVWQRREFRVGRRARRQSESGRAAYWLGAGRGLEVGLPLELWEPRQARQDALLRYKSVWMLPNAPGHPVNLSPDLGPVRCSHAFFTGRKRMVLVCREAVSAVKPSLRAGLRVLRWK